MPTLICHHCEISFHMKASRAKTGRGKFCSSICLRAHREFVHSQHLCLQCNNRIDHTTQNRDFCCRDCQTLYRQPTPQSIRERFWSMVDASATPDGCWEWTRARDTKNYG